MRALLSPAEWAAALVGGLAAGCGVGLAVELGVRFSPWLGWAVAFVLLSALAWRLIAAVLHRAELDRNREVQAARAAAAEPAWPAEAVVVPPARVAPEAGVWTVAPDDATAP